MVFQPLSFQHRRFFPTQQGFRPDTIFRSSNGQEWGDRVHHFRCQLSADFTPLSKTLDGGAVLSAGCWVDMSKTPSPTAIKAVIQRKGECNRNINRDLH